MRRGEDLRVEYTYCNPAEHLEPQGQTAGPAGLGTFCLLYHLPGVIMEPEPEMGKISTSNVKIASYENYHNLHRIVPLLRKHLC